MNWRIYFKILSVVFVLMGFTILGFTFFPVVSMEVGYAVKKQPSETIPPIDIQFGIVIPKIGANSKIVKDVDPFDSVVYQRALMIGVAHAKGTPLPGEPGTSFLFSHSSANFYQAAQYNSIFYLLTKLEKGDPITIYRDGVKYDFLVEDKKIISADSLDVLKQTGNKPEILLMTCWPPGTNLKRLIISARLAP